MKMSCFLHDGRLKKAVHCGISPHGLFQCNHHDAAGAPGLPAASPRVCGDIIPPQPPHSLVGVSAVTAPF